MSAIKYLAILVSEETKDIVTRITTGYNLGDIPIKFIYVDHPKILSVMKKTNYIKSVPALVASFVGVSEKSIYYDLKIFQVLSEISSKNTINASLPPAEEPLQQEELVPEVNYEPPSSVKVVNVGKVEGLGVGPSSPGMVIENEPPETEPQRRKRKNYKVHTDPNTTMTKESGVGIPSTEGKSNVEIIEEMKKARETMDQEFKSRNTGYVPSSD